MEPHRCAYDENGRCFECDKPRPTKAAMMGRLRKDRADAGLVEVRLWVTPATRQEILDRYKPQSTKPAK